MTAWRRATSLTPLTIKSPSCARYYWKTIEATKRAGSITEVSIPKAQGKLGDLLQHSEKSEELLGELEVQGFVRSIRKQKRIAFAAIGDGSNLLPIQAVLEPAQAET